jgi:hypothetical protein
MPAKEDVTDMDGRVFLYRGFASGLGGSLRRPFTEVVDGRASIALPIVGGYTAQRIDNYRHREIISIKEVRTYATGNQAKDGSYHTVVSATMEGLNILDFITADAITARLSSRHAADGAEPEIVTAGSTFHNLKIGGHPAEVELDHQLFCSLPTYSALRARFDKDADFKAELQRRFMWTRPPNTLPPGFAANVALPNRSGWPESRGTVPCSLVRDIRCNAPEFERYGHILCVPQVGYIALGELFVSQYARRLTMMRLILGSPFEGDLSGCDVETDGTTYP